VGVRAGCDEERVVLGDGEAALATAESRDDEGVEPGVRPVVRLDGRGRRQQDQGGRVADAERLPVAVLRPEDHPEGPGALGRGQAERGVDGEPHAARREGEARIDGDARPCLHAQTPGDPAEPDRAPEVEHAFP